MSWRVVTVSSMAKLDYKMDYLVVRTQEDTKRVHLSEISVLILESTAISMTAYLLCELSKRKIDVLFCDEKRLPYGVLAPLYGSHDTSSKLKSQIKWSSGTKALVWAEIVRAKIDGQACLLEKKEHLEEAGLLREYIRQLEPGDAGNREGHAAKVHFNALFGMSFSRSQENNINAALNYGYGIFLSAFAREAAACGYATQLGIFHDNMFNQFNLACDLMEPFRPYVDACVADMELCRFEHEEKMQLVRLLNKQISIDGSSQYMLRAIKIYCKSVFDAMSENDTALLRFPLYEL